MSQRRFESKDLEPWIVAQFDRAAGPGGQHVNKVATRVTLLFDFESCPLLTSFQKSRIRQCLSTRLARDGRLRVVSQRERTQLGNRLAAAERLVALLKQALHRPRPRRPTAPTQGSRQRRLRAKRRRGEIKRLRREKPSAEE